MALNDGTFVEIEYVGKVKKSGEIFDLTDEKLAKEKKIFNPHVKYGPITVVLGNHQLLSGLEAKMKDMKLGEKKSFVLEPKEAFGERSAEFVKTIPVSEFHKQNMQPQVGQFLRLANNVEGRILSVSGGRVRVDFNHPLSGKSLEYDLKLNKIVERPEEQISAIFEYYTRMDAKAVKLDKEKGAATIEFSAGGNIPPAAKKKISDDIVKFVSGIKEVSFTEIFSGAKEPEKSLERTK